jgi:hypothetical protein
MADLLTGGTTNAGKAATGTGLILAIGLGKYKKRLRLCEAGSQILANLPN